MAKARILHVDDDSAILRMVRRVLADYNVVSAPSIEDARAEDAHGPFDLYIVDGKLKVPGDGFRYAQELQATGKKVFLFTGELPDTLPKGILCLPKPSANADILAMVSQVLAKGGAKP